MQLRHLAAGAACIVSIAAGPAASAQNLIADGDFRNVNATYAMNVTGGFGDAASPDAWTVTGGNVDVVGGYWQSPSGTNVAGQPPGLNGSVDLDGTTAGAISQTFTAATAGEYVLTFDLSSNPDGGVTSRSLDVTIDGQKPTEFTALATPHDRAAMGYKTETLTFTAAAGKNTLSFASLEGGSYGAVIGDVSVVSAAGPVATGSVSAAPEPETWALMIAGVAIVGSMLRRTRRATSAQALGHGA